MRRWRATSDDRRGPGHTLCQAADLTSGVGAEPRCWRSGTPGGAASLPRPWPPRGSPAHDGRPSRGRLHAAPRPVPDGMAAGLNHHIRRREQLMPTGRRGLARGFSTGVQECAGDCAPLVPPLFTPRPPARRPGGQPSPPAVAQAAHRQAGGMGMRRHDVARGAASVALTGAVIAALPGVALADDHGAGGGRSATPIQHLVVIFQENVSFDHYFGTYPHAANTDGTRFTAAPGTPSVNGLEQDALLTANPIGANPQRLGPAQAVTCDQNHGYTAEQKAYDGGAMDKFIPNTDVET